MQSTLIAIVGVLSLVAVATVSDRVGVAAPLGLVVVGIGLSFLPALGTISPNPHWVLAGVLPPLLYATAVRTPATDFRRDMKAIVGLAVLLVAVTTVVGAYVLHGLLPAISLAAAFALAAVISPTDAVAATAMGGRLGLPRRLITILEGEGLVNDATALVLLGAAVSATTTPTPLWHIALRFVASVAVAIAIGWVVGELGIRVRGHLKDPILTTTVSFVVPFIAFAPVEELHGSGVLAAVVCGLVTGYRSPSHLSPQDRLAESVNWATVAFLLENGIFLLFGLQLKTLIDETGAAHLSPGQAVWIGLAAAALVVVLRILFVAPLVASMRRDAERAEQMIPMLERMLDRVRALDPSGHHGARRRTMIERRVTRKRADAEYATAQRFGWRGGTVLAWAGMRGAVTLAAAQSLPRHFAERPELLLIAFVVAATTLIVQGLTLPRVIAVVRIPGDDPAAARAAYRDLLGELVAPAEQLLDDPELADFAGRRYPVPVIERVRDDLRIRVAPPEGTEQLEIDPREHYVELMLRALDAERGALLRARSSGRFSSHAISRAQRSLDVEQARLERLTGGFGGDTA